MRCTTIVTDSEVSGDGLVSFRSSSSKKPPFAATTGVATTPPLPDTTVSVRVVLAVVEPAAAAMAIVNVPVLAGLAAVSVRVAPLAPELFVVVGPNAAVTPAGSPLAVNATVPVKPVSFGAPTEKAALDPALIVAAVGLTKTAKSDT